MKELEVNENCIGCGCCEVSCPELIKVNEGKAEVIKQPETEEKKQELKDICPVKAIVEKE